MISKQKTVFGNASSIVPNISQDFEALCIWIIIKAYNKMMSKNDYNKTWKETKFTAVLYKYMRCIRKMHDKKIMIVYEGHLLDDEEYIYDDPDKAPRIDLKLSGNWYEEDVYYGVESKILVQSNWGTREHSYLKNRYINTGIDNYKSGKYASKVRRSCIVGYIVQGSSSKTVEDINTILKKKQRHSECLKTYSTQPPVYRSEHVRQNKLTIELKHIILCFTN